jgi:ATP phosphoribosyltransferase regulatory subunit HisZ
MISFDKTFVLRPDLTVNIKRILVNEENCKKQINTIK